MSRNHAATHQAILLGRCHLIIGDRLVRDLIEIFASVRPLLFSLGEPPWPGDQNDRVLEGRSVRHDLHLLHFQGSSYPGDQVGNIVGLPFDWIERKIQTEARGIVYGPAESGDGHISDQFYERQRGKVERKDPQPG